MDRKEAIQILEEEANYLYKDDEPYCRQAFDMAIEALSADAVPRSEKYKKGFEDAKRAFLIEYARESENMRKRNAELEVMLNAQKAISAEAEWIPCSERLPEDGQGVIICTDDNRFKDHPVGTCIYEDGSFHTTFYDDISIIAWMPLPPVYQGE